MGEKSSTNVLCKCTRAQGQGNQVQDKKNVSDKKIHLYTKQYCTLLWSWIHIKYFNFSKRTRGIKAFMNA